jgi:hypothetical protein
MQSYQSSRILHFFVAHRLASVFVEITGLLKVQKVKMESLADWKLTVKAW